MKNKRVIISGGGTGGHIFPAISIAESLKELDPSVEILFVGAQGRMEMEKVPQAGYRIIGLPIAGLQRSLSLSNLALPFKILKSLVKARRVIKDFGADCAVGVGGYASAPLLWSAANMGIACLIQEQNSFAGLSNKVIGKKAKCICTAYEGMEKFFPADRIVLTGNPLRKSILNSKELSPDQAKERMGLDPLRPCVLIIGGSLGAAALNNCVKGWVNNNKLGKDIQYVWQSGRAYQQELSKLKDQLPANVHSYDFISDMDIALRAADLVISRAGASTISELAYMGKACIFVPSPYVSEDHQTHNAKALVNKGAALMVENDQVDNSLLESINELINNKERITSLEENIANFARPNAGKDIASQILRLIEG